MVVGPAVVSTSPAFMSSVRHPAGRMAERSIINYAASVCSNLYDTNYRSIQYAQNEALRSVTGCHKMSGMDHLYAEAKMLKVREHSELLSAQYLARYLEPENVCHSITTRDPLKDG